MAVVGALAMGVFVGTPSEAQAHNSLIYYPHIWNPSSDINWYIRAQFPSNAYYERILDGTNDWLAVRSQDGRIARFVYKGTTTSVGTTTACAASFNAVYYAQTPASNYWGWTETCFTDTSGGPIYRFSMRIDPDKSWYTGTAAPGTGQLDLYGGATHEFGHAIGSGHFTDSATCPLTSAQATMCEVSAGRLSHLRSLDTHDRHTIVAAY